MLPNITNERLDAVSRANLNVRGTEFINLTQTTKVLSNICVCMIKYMCLYVWRCIGRTKIDRIESTFSLSGINTVKLTSSSPGLREIYYYERCSVDELLVNCR